MSKIHFFQAGGTIDKEYPEGENHHGYNFEIGTPAFERVIHAIDMPVCDYEQTSVCKLDSLDMKEGDIWRIMMAIQHSPHQLCIVTHGTDTIKNTAQNLKPALVGDKVIVLTGARKPERFKDSDAEFNLGMAIAAVQILPTGIYIALDRKVVPWEAYNPD